MQVASIDCCYGNAVFIRINRIILTLKIDVASVNRQMKLGIKPFILCRDAQNTSTLLAAVDIHTHSGIECAVILMEFLCRTFFIDTSYIRAIHNIFGTICNNDIGTRCRSIHDTFRVYTRIRAFIYTIEKDSRRHRTSDVHTVQDQGYNRIWIT